MAEARLIDGKAIADGIRAKLKIEVDELVSKQVTPCLVVFRVGERKDSITYVNMKKKACEEIGIKFILLVIPDTVTQASLLEQVQQYNAQADVHGILVQLPLPAHIDEKTILDAISLNKDVDGFHPMNIGSLGMKGRAPTFVSGTPKGCLRLLDEMGTAIEGKRAVVIGRSNIVGLPMSLLLLGRNATVTVVHSRTPRADMEALCREADIVVAAAGQAELVRGSWLKPGATVIDCGINAVDDSTRASGYRLVGDVAFQEARAALGPQGAITPVPGGVGPMTIAMLLTNVLAGARASLT
eukprot:TRINITY_DN14657_c0_g1_i1.p1 TRINITY_DN14657_c0_g1~~TRINITY_DN14657_c0_g1_i1.p1  ORF type:complete len:308 (+),score=66.81 TRINITY_DN14657_c0_g1_i1:31-924(+)